MDLNKIIILFILFPFAGFISSLFIKEKKEHLLSRIAMMTAGFQFFSVLIYILFWISSGAGDVNVKEVTLFSNDEYVFFIDFYFDKVTSAFLLTGSFITFLITRYSRYYMHLESGYKRFFNSILFFYLGYNWTVLSGNFETLFIGWEILGISSFLLIAFYRDRYLPVRNAVKVFSIYRIGDVGIILAMWASHHLWHENITFLKLQNQELVHEHLMYNSGIGLFIGICILIAAAAKSAMVPFSSWLPRAMEGPTPSSAIFYGSLSVHFGVFLLLRTYPFWESQIAVRIMIGVLGLITAFIALQITRVQSTIKTQVAYASITQIGIMFIEISLGWHSIALIHFTGNAFLRTFQLLVSPSVVAYLIRDQLYGNSVQKKIRFNFLSQKWKNTLYILSVHEWYLPDLMYHFIFNPFKQIGKRLNFITVKNVFYIVIPFYVSCVFLYRYHHQIHPNLARFLPELFSFIGLLMVMKAFSERKHPRLAWLLIIFNHFWVALAVSFNEDYAFEENFIYLSGIFLSGLVGYYCLFLLRKKEPLLSDLQKYYGHVQSYPKLAFVFLLCTMALMGFPITPSFVGEDLIFSHIHDHQFVLGFLNSLSFILDGIALIRIYSRLFLGPHEKNNHAVPILNS
jgi:NADH-quinone oxidoreductase subunit L